MTISTLRPTIESQPARDKLMPWNGWLPSTLRGFAKIYLPYRMYRVATRDRHVENFRYFALDAVAGTLDAYEFASVPEAGCWAEIETRNCHPITLKESQTREFAIEKVRRLLFSRGFFRLAYPQITAELVHPDFYIPYWVGFYGNERNIRIRVLDAVRQTVEGNKVRQIVRAWLMEDSSLVPAMISFPKSGR